MSKLLLIKKKQSSIKKKDIEILSSVNINNIYPNTFTFIKNIDIGKNIGYPFVFCQNNTNYIYYRDIHDKPQPEHECTKRFVIKNYTHIENDESFKLELGRASHNFRLFNFDNNICGFGGQALLDLNICQFNNTTNKNYKSYETNIKYLNCKDYNIKYRTYKNYGHKFIDPTFFCPYYGNGLYLFKYEDNIFKEVIDKPIISGIKNGRYDGNYFNSDGINLEKAKNGLTVFDSTTNILYNEKNKTYYLYQRANLGKDIRYIQYSTSTNLIDWSDFNLIKLGNEFNIMDINIYYGNFFKIEGFDTFIAILPINYKNIPLSKVKNEQHLVLFYSIDCINWNFIGKMKTDEYYSNWMCIGQPLINGNNFYFYMFNKNTKNISVYNLPRNRFSYLLIENEEKLIKFKPLFFESNKIKINMTIFNNGYVSAQLKDINGNIIDGYSFSDFETLKGHFDSFDYELSWKNTEVYSNKLVKLEIIGINFKIYSIGTKLIQSELLD